MQNKVHILQSLWRDNRSRNTKKYLQ